MPKFLFACFFAALGLLSAVPAVAEEAAPAPTAESLFAQRANSALYALALVEYERLYAKTPPDCDKALFLARAYFNFGERYFSANPKKAAQLFGLSVKWADVALAKKPGDYSAVYLREMSILHSGMLRPPGEALAQVQRSKIVLEQLIRSFPDKAPAYAALGRLYRDAPDWPVGMRDLTKAEDLLAKAAAIAPNDADIAYEYARCLAVRSEFKEARTVLMKIESFPPEPGWEVESDVLKKAARQIMTELRGK